jgi:hypothetical protein
MLEDFVDGHVRNVWALEEVRLKIKVKNIVTGSRRCIDHSFTEWPRTGKEILISF